MKKAKTTAFAVVFMIVVQTICSHPQSNHGVLHMVPGAVIITEE
jgi:hypothetical protein